MSVELLDGAMIMGFIEDDEAFNGSVEDRFNHLDTNQDGLLTYSEMLKELQCFRMIETHSRIDVKTDHDLNGTVDLEEFKAETKMIMIAMANNLGFLPMQMILHEDSFLKKAVDRELTKLQSHDTSAN